MAQADLRVLPMQLLAASVVASSGDLRRACEIAKRAMIAFPTSAAPARQAAELLAVSGRWEEALDAGLAWRDRAGRLELRPELFVANAMLRSGRALDAANGLELHTRAALADPINNEVLLLTYTTALVRSERVTRATEILNELAAKHERWRTAPLAVTAASLGSPQNVSVWLKACAANIPAGDAHARVLLAQAWAGAWNTYPSPEFLAAAKTALSGVLELPAVPPQAYMVAASVAESEGDLDAAQKHYEAALQRDSSLVVAHNNLAMILADKGRWKEAVEEAGKAAAGAPRSAEIQETVAYAWRKGGELGKARAAIEQAIALDPANPKWRISLAELSCEAGSVDEARALVVRVDEMAETGPVLPTSLRERLERVRARTQN
jgi:tetratricopeptide (TPR) repeat protein